MTHKKIVAFLIVSAVLVSGQLVFAKDGQEKHAEKDREVSSIVVPFVSSGSTVQIEKNGKVNIQEARVSSVSGSTITATTTWGGFTLTWTITTEGMTNIKARTGGGLSVSDITAGDLINFRGMIVPGGSSGPTVVASVITDLSMQRRQATLTGMVTSVASSSASFVLKTQERGMQTVLVSSSTKFLGQLTSFSDIQIGGRVRTSGLWNTEQNSLQASQIMIIKDATSVERIFEGTIRSVNTSSTPKTIVATIQGVDRTINLAVDTAVLNFWWQKVSVASFHEGDIIRVYGLGDDFSISATVVRDVSLK